MKNNYFRLFGLFTLTTQLSFSQEVTDTIKTQNIEESKKSLISFKKNFSQTDGTIVFSNPSYKVWVGSFKSKIEAEKAKGNVIDRLNSIEHKKLVYKFNIADFNNFCRSVYAEVESGSHIKKRSHIVKKVGKMWRDMEDEEKAVYNI